MTQSLTRTIVSTPIMATTTAASQEAAAAIEAMEAENAEAIEGLPMQVITIAKISFSVSHKLTHSKIRIILVEDP